MRAWTEEVPSGVFLKNESGLFVQHSKWKADIYAVALAARMARDSLSGRGMLGSHSQSNDRKPEHAMSYQRLSGRTSSGSGIRSEKLSKNRKVCVVIISEVP